MCSKALAIWRVLARNYSAGLWKDLSENGSCGTSVGKRSGEEIAATEAAKILKASSDEDLVLEHLGWVCISGKGLCLSYSEYILNVYSQVADIDQELAITVLTSEMRNNQLSPGDCSGPDKPMHQYDFAK